MTPLRANIFKFMDATLGETLCRLTGALTGRNGSAQPFPSSPPDPRRILVLRPGGLGDLIMLLPVLNTLKTRFPDASLDLVCEKRNRDALHLSNIEIRPLLYDTAPARFLHRLKQSRYDVVIDTEQFHHFSALFAWFSGAPVRIGFNINPHRNPLYTHLIHYASDGYEGDQFMRLLAPLGAADAPYRLDGFLRDATLDSADPVGKTPASGPFAILHPGVGSRHKQWAPERYAELARRIAETLDMNVVVLQGCANDRATDRIVGALNALNHPHIRIEPFRPLRETAALIRRGKLLIGPDSGLTHLAVALGTPTVTLFGPSDPWKWGINNPLHRAVHKPQPCAPCALFGYHKPCRAIACMQAIAVDDVLSAVESVFGTTDDSSAAKPQPNQTKQPRRHECYSAKATKHKE